MNSAHVPMYAALIGASVASVTAVVVNFLSSVSKRKETLTTAIFDEVIAARNDVAEKVCVLISIPDSELLQKAILVKYRDYVTVLFYKYYDFLPVQVLNAILLLEAALNNPGKGPYKLVNQMILPIEKDEELLDFIKNCTVIENGIYTACIMIKNPDPDKVTCEIIRLHARNVLYTMNTYASIGKYMQLTNDLRKKYS